MCTNHRANLHHCVVDYAIITLEPVAAAFDDSAVLHDFQVFGDIRLQHVFQFAYLADALLPAQQASQYAKARWLGEYLESVGQMIELAVRKSDVGFVHYIFISG